MGICDVGGGMDIMGIEVTDMDDTISRRDTLDALTEQADEMSRWCERYQEQRKGVLTARNIIKDLPPAQKKGHWIDEGTNYSCSECHRGCWVNSNYCPWCGADMRGESDE